MAKDIKAQALAYLRGEVGSHAPAHKESEVEAPSAADDIAETETTETEEPEVTETEEEPEEEDFPEEWKAILNAVPEEYWDSLKDPLKSWDKGVSSRFEQLNSKIKPYEELGDPDDLRNAANMYQMLINDPENTYAQIGEAFGLTPKQQQQLEEVETEEDYDELPQVVREKLAKVDEMSEMLSRLVEQDNQREQAEAEAAEQRRLDEYFEGLKQSKGDFDEEFVLGLMSSGVEAEDAIDRYNDLVKRLTPKNVAPVKTVKKSPKILSNRGGVSSETDKNSLRAEGEKPKDTVIRMLQQANNA